MTAFSQITLNDSLTCFNKEQLSKIAKDLKKVNVQDSIIQTQQFQIINFKEVIKVDEQIISENNKRLSELKKSLTKTELKLKISKRLSIYGIPIAFGGGAFLVILLSN